MKTLTSTLAILALVLMVVMIGTDTASAQDRGNGYRVRDFVDNDGDGFNDLAPDHDGDGIPNGQDPDYVRPQDGSGNRHGNPGEPEVNGGNKNWYRNMYQWLSGVSGDVIGFGPGNGYGPGDGTGNGGNGPQDGTGNGPGGDGDCDGDGPHRP